MDVGEEIARAYLQYVRGCDFTACNVPTSGSQGEVDVMGIDLKSKTIYICEVAVHLTTGLLYVSRDGQPDNVGKLVAKFERGIDHVRAAFPEHSLTAMLWSPIVRASRAGAKHDQMRDVAEIAAKVQDSRGITVELIVNEIFQQCLAELRDFARQETKALKSPILRFMQVEEYLAKRFNKGERSTDAASLVPPIAHPALADSPTIISIVNDALDADPEASYEKVEGLVKAQHPSSKFNRQHFSWYKWERRNRSRGQDVRLSHRNAGAAPAEGEAMRSSWFWCLRCNRAFDALVDDDYDPGHGLPDGIGQMYLNDDGNPGWRCPYESCGVGIEDNVIDWLLVQENHPEYPDEPEKGKVYRIEPDEK